MKKILIVVGALSLIACSEGPSESDINKAFKLSMEERNRQMASFGLGRDFNTEVPEVKKLGCKDDGGHAYKCDVEVMTKTGNKIIPARFVKSSDGWVVTN